VGRLYSRRSQIRGKKGKDREQGISRTNNSRKKRKEQERISLSQKIAEAS
jgi:hypothetical protein